MIYLTYSAESEKQKIKNQKGIEYSNCKNNLTLLLQMHCLTSIVHLMNIILSV
ncbi:hypothetical protein BLGI_473 [Brevibacillus laterosporus GI-9]|nr:hypothetical protein BLGI_473 [Brevibacillus laterosporus GI-9]